MLQSNCNGFDNETALNETQLKERWERMVKSVSSNVDYMDTNHWMYLNSAIEQVESLMCLPNPEISYRKAFIRLNKEVREDYVHTDNPETDIHEETYHLLKYFELGFAEHQTFRTYMQVKKEELRGRKYSGRE